MHSSAKHRGPRPLATLPAAVPALLLAAAGGLLGGCEARPNPMPPAVSTTIVTSGIPERCAPASGADVVALEGTRLFFADERTGVSVFELEDMSRPRRVASSPFVGAPRALFVDHAVVWVVFVDADARGRRGHTATTVLRSIDARRPGEIRREGEVAIAGAARDIEISGGVVHVLVDDEAAGSRIVPVIRSETGSLRAGDGLTLPGKAAALTATSGGLAALTVAGERADSTTRVSWVDLPPGEAPGTMSLAGTLEMKGGFPTWQHERARPADCDARRRVRFLGCATNACAPDEAATLRVVDFGSGSPSLRSTFPISARGGLVAARFSGEELFVAEPGPKGHGYSEVRVIDLADDAHPRVGARARVPGIVTTLLPREDGLVTLARVVGDDGSVKLGLSHLERARPDALRSRGTVSFGDDFTWSVAEDDPSAATFHPGEPFLALPTTTWNRKTRTIEQGARIVSLGSGAPRVTATLPSETRLDRVVFALGKVVTVGQAGIEVFDWKSGEATPGGEVGSLRAR